MNKKLTDYITVLSDNHFDIFEEIILQKYRKFIKFYELVKDSTDQIDKLKYNFTDKNTLDVEIIYKTRVKKSLKEDLISDIINLGYDVGYNINGKTLAVQITYDESKLS